MIFIHKSDVVIQKKKKMTVYLLIYFCMIFIHKSHVVVTKRRLLI